MTPTTTMSIYFKWLRQPFCFYFLMDPSQKLIRSSEIPREPYQIWMQSNQRFISYRAHKLFMWPSWKMAAYGLVSKKIYGP